MANVITCPKCERSLRVPDDLIGQSVKCPSCGETFTAKIGGKVSSRPPEEERPSRRVPRRDDDEDNGDEGGSRRRRLAPHRGDMIQILGILAFIPVLGLPFILGPIAWIMGNTDLREMDAGRMDPAGRKATETGRTCGKIAVIVYACIAAAFALFYLAMVIFIFVVYGSLACCACGAAGAGAGGN
jgi:predicted Zn finger-like uncharacterized protein